MKHVHPLALTATVLSLLVGWATAAPAAPVPSARTPFAQPAGDPKPQSTFAASESTVSRAARVGVAGGATSSSGYRSSAQLAGVPLEGRSSSASFTATATFVALDENLAPGVPIVLAVEPPIADSAGGSPVRVVGVRLDEAGAGLPAVTFGGASAPVSTESSTMVDVLVPSGIGATGNPLGSVDVGVETLAGTGVASEALLYTPGLCWGVLPRVGETTAVDFRGDPNALVLLLYGNSTPGVFVPLPPIEGALELIPFKVLLAGAVAGSDGALTHTVPVPDQPGLAGYLLEVQGIALEPTNPSQGGFTNRITAAIGN